MPSTWLISLLVTLATLVILVILVTAVYRRTRAFPTATVRSFILSHPLPSLAGIQWSVPSSHHCRFTRCTLINDASGLAVLADALERRGILDRRVPPELLVQVDIGRRKVQDHTRPPARAPPWYHETNMYSIVEATLLAPIRSLLRILDEPYRSRHWALEGGGTAARTDFRLVPEGPSIECKAPSMRDETLLDIERRASASGNGWNISPMDAPRDKSQQLAGQLLAQLESRQLTWGVITNGNVWITFRRIAQNTCHVLPPILASHTSFRQHDHPVHPDALAHVSRQHARLLNLPFGLVLALSLLTPEDMFVPLPSIQPRLGILIATDRDNAGRQRHGMQLRQRGPWLHGQAEIQPHPGLGAPARDIPDVGDADEDDRHLEWLASFASRLVLSMPPSQWYHHPSCLSLDGKLLTRIHHDSSTRDAPDSAPSSPTGSHSHDELHPHSHPTDGLPPAAAARFIREHSALAVVAAANGFTRGSSDSDSGSVTNSIDRPACDTHEDNDTPLTSPESAFGHGARRKAASAGAGDPNGHTLSISLDEPCGRGAVWQAYRGTLRSGDVASKVVVKIRHFDRSAALVSEADEELARDAIMNEDQVVSNTFGSTPWPHYLGLYQYRYEEGEWLASVWKDGGVSTETAVLSQAEQRALLRLYERLHSIGILHNDPAPRNWVVGPPPADHGGGPRRVGLIDFTSACKMEMDPGGTGSESKSEATRRFAESSRIELATVRMILEHERA